MELGLRAVLADVEKRMVWMCGSRGNYMFATSLIIKSYAYFMKFNHDTGTLNKAHMTGHKL